MSLWDPIKKVPEVAKAPTSSGGIWSNIKTSSVDNSQQTPTPSIPVSSTPVNETPAATGLWAKVTPTVVSKPTIVPNLQPQDGSVISPYQFKTTTPATLAPGQTGTLDILKKAGNYLLNPNAETSFTPIGYTEESAKKLPPIKGPRIIMGPAKILADFPKAIVQAIPRAYEVLKNDVINPGQTKEVPLGGMEKFLVGEEKYKTINQDIKDRLDRGDGVFSSYLGAISQKTLDVAFGAQIAATGFKVLSNVLARPGADAQIEAWKTLGSPQTEAELKANFRDLSKQFHPDVTGGDDTAFKVLSRANQILEGKVPTTVDLIKNNVAKGSELLGRESSIWGDLLKPDIMPKVDAGATLPFKALPGTAETPGQAPAMGMSIKKVEPVGYAATEAIVESPVTTKILKDLEGKNTVSKQYILDATNRPELKQQERDLIRTVLDGEGSTVNAKDFAQKVKAELLPLKRVSSTNDVMNGESSRYENITLPTNVRGDIANYSENIYESPIKTSAGNTHFSGDTQNYFGHTRVEDMAEYGTPAQETALYEKLGKTEYEKQYKNRDKIRRVIEVQSDLYQKGNLEKEFDRASRIDGSMANKPLTVDLAESNLSRLKDDLAKFKDGKRGGQLSDESFFFDSEKDFTTRIDRWEKLLEEAKSGKLDAKKAELSKLQQYSNPTAHFRMVREEIKKAAEDGVTKLQFPVGETAMKIEGLGQEGGNTRWRTAGNGHLLKPEELKLGQEINSNGQSNWIITDIIGDGRFKAAPKSEGPFIFEDGKVYVENPGTAGRPKMRVEFSQTPRESFDISGKVDINNPIYKFYEKDLSKYLTSKYNAKLVTDSKGVNWMEVAIDKSMNGPVEAFKVANRNPIRDIVGRFAPGKMHPEDIALAKDFIDFYDGSYRAITPEAEQNLTQDAFRIAERYGGLKGKNIKSTKALANFLDELTKGKTGKYNFGGKLTGTKLPVADIKKALYELIPEKDVRLSFKEDLIDGVAEGRYSKSDMNGYKSVLKPMIELYSENGLASLDTAYHEAGHYILDNYLSKAEKAQFIAQARKELGPMKEIGYKLKGYNRSADQRAEEYLMDEYAKAKIKGGAYDPKYKTFFDKVDAILKKIIDGFNKTVDHVKKLLKESGEGGYIKNPMADGAPKPRKVGEVTVGGKKIDITKGGKMDLTPELEQLKVQIELKSEELSNSPFKNKDNRFMVNKEGDVRELGDIKSPKLVKKMETMIAESGVKDPAEYAAGVEKYMQEKDTLEAMKSEFDIKQKAKEKVVDLKKDITKLESYGISAKNLKQDIARTVEEADLAMTNEGVPMKLSREGIPLALTARQKKLLTAQRFISGPEKYVPPVAGEEGEVRSIEIQAQEALSRANQEAGSDIGAFSIPQAIDNFQTPVKKKINFIDYIRTPDKVLEKIGMGEYATLLRENYDKYLKELPLNIEKITEWAKKVPEASNTRIFDYLDGKAITLTGDEKRVAVDIKNWLKEWATRLGLPKEEQITHYITHIFDDQLIKKEFDEDLAKIIDQKVPGSVYDPFLEKRLGVLGYKQDTWAALDAYVKRATRKVWMDPVLEKMQSKIGSSAELSNVELSQWKYVQRYINNLNLRPTEWDTLIDNWVKTSPIEYRLGQRPTAKVTRIMRKVTSRAMLGLNVSSALRNLSQGVNTYAKLGEKYTAIGYSKLFSTGSWEEIAREGVLGNDMIQDRSMSATKKAWEKVDKTLYFLFENVEKVNRGAAYMGAKSKFLAENAKSLADKGAARYEIEAKAVEYAKKMVRDTQFTFGTIDTPVFLQGDLVKTGLMFQSFTTKQIEFLNEMRKNKEWSGFVRYIIGGLAVFYSIGKLYNMSIGEILPSYRLGMPAPLKFGYEVGKAAFNAPDAYGRPRSFKQKVSDITKAGVTGVVPAGTQLRKTFNGIKSLAPNMSTVDKVRQSVFGKPYVAPAAKDTSPNATALSNALKKTTDRRKAFRPTYDKIVKLWESGDSEAATKAWEALTPIEQADFKTISTSEKAATTKENQKDVVDEVQKVMKMVKDGDTSGAQAVWESMDEAHQKAFTSVWKKLNP